MALTDPQTITINAVPFTLPRVTTGDGTATYRDATGLVELVLASTYGKRIRHVFRLNHSKITADPFLPAQNVKVSTSQYMVFDVPIAGYTNTEIIQQFAGLNALVTASGSAVVTKLLGGES